MSTALFLMVIIWKQAHSLPEMTGTSKNPATSYQCNQVPSCVPLCQDLALFVPSLEGIRFRHVF